MRGNLLGRMAILAIWLLLATASAPAQEPTGDKITPRDFAPPAEPPGWERAPQLPGTPPVEIRGFGSLDEAPEATHQAGNAAMRYFRRGALALLDALRHLQLACVEGDGEATVTGRRACRLLFETVRENDPSDIVGDDLDALRGRLTNPRQGDPKAIVSRLERAAQNFGPLFPTRDFEAETSSLDRLVAAKLTDEALAGVHALREAVMAFPTTAPLASAQAAFAEAEKLLDGKRTEAARPQIKLAMAAVSAAHTAGYLGEAVWYLTRAADALDQGLPEIARVSLGNGGVLLSAADESGPAALRAGLAGLRAEVVRAQRQLADGQRPPVAFLRELAGRTQLLAVPY